jgi:pSer/pThr/pTyr-binding forkhead associated (FHA) protein
LEKKSIFKSKENKSKEIIAGVEVERPEKYENAAPVYMAKDVESEETCVEEAVFGAHLQLVGRGALPVTISVQAEPGEPFTIGRYDVSIAQKQSSFEFAKDTVAVSRHHAAIEKKEDGSYYVVDQNSKAGTFLNGERLTPGVPYAITWGDCIAFGTGEARYTWEK